MATDPFGAGAPPIMPGLMFGPMIPELARRALEPVSQRRRTHYPLPPVSAAELFETRDVPVAEKLGMERAAEMQRIAGEALDVVPESISPSTYMVHSYALREHAQGRDPNPAVIAALATLGQGNEAVMSIFAPQPLGRQSNALEAVNQQLARRLNQEDIVNRALAHSYGRPTDIAAETASGANALGPVSISGPPAPQVPADFEPRSTRWLLNDEKSFNSLRKRLMGMARTGEQAGRFWYENAGDEILNLFGGDREAATKFAGLAAIYSPQRPIQENASLALQAYQQWRLGQPIVTSGGTYGMDRLAEEFLAGNAEPRGPKVNSFYKNLLIRINPSLLQDIDPEHAGRTVTVDTWMARAFGYTAPSGSVTAPQREFMDREIRQIADQLGWEPQQVQAAIWTTAKWAAEQTEAGLPPGVKPLPSGVMPPAEQLLSSAQHFGDALRDRFAQVSWESAPGRESGVLPGYHSAALAQKLEYHQAISRALIDDQGRDIIAQKLGIPSPGSFDAPGVYKGEVSPGGQVPISVPALETEGQLRPEGRQLLDLYAAMRGYVLHQESVGWTRPFYKASGGEKMMDVQLGRTLSFDEMQALGAVLDSKLGGTDNHALVSNPKGVWVLNFTGKAPAEFERLVDDALRSLPDIKAGTRLVPAESNLVQGGPNGRGYQAAIARSGRSDLQGWLQGLVAPRVHAVNELFDAKYGWGDPGVLTDAEREPVAREPARPREYLTPRPIRGAIARVNPDETLRSSYSGAILQRHIRRLLPIIGDIVRSTPVKKNPVTAQVPPVDDMVKWTAETMEARDSGVLARSGITPEENLAARIVAETMLGTVRGTDPAEGFEYSKAASMFTRAVAHGAPAARRAIATLTEVLKRDDSRIFRDLEARAGGGRPPAEEGLPLPVGRLAPPERVLTGSQQRALERAVTGAGPGGALSAGPGGGSEQSATGGSVLRRQPFARRGSQISLETSPIAQELYARLAGSWKNGIQLPGDVRLISSDTWANRPPSELESSRALPALTRAFKMSANELKAIGALWGPEFAKVGFGGFDSEPGTFGITLARKVTGKTQPLVLLNPWLAQDRAITAARTGVARDLGMGATEYAAWSMVATLVHEMIHPRVLGHGPEFNNEYARLMAATFKIMDRIQQRLVNVLSKAEVWGALRNEAKLTGIEADEAVEAFQKERPPGLARVGRYAHRLPPPVPPVPLTPAQQMGLFTNR